MVREVGNPTEVLVPSAVLLDVYRLLTVPVSNPNPPTNNSPKPPIKLGNGWLVNYWGSSNTQHLCPVYNLFENKSEYRIQLGKIPDGQLATGPVQVMVHTFPTNFDTVPHPTVWLYIEKDVYFTAVEEYILLRQKSILSPTNRVN